MKGLFVTGTDTDVGKTLVTAGIARALRSRGWDVGICKPVQSGALAEDPEGDAMKLKTFVGLDESPEMIAPFAFHLAAAPLIAAQAEGVVIGLQAVVAATEAIAALHELVLLEGSGGLLAPLGDRFTNAELAQVLDLPLLIVARAGLGTVNHTWLTVRVAREFGLKPIGVILNGEGDETTTSNRRLIEELVGVPVLGRTPHLAGEITSVRIETLIEQNIDLDSIAAHLVTEGEFACLPLPPQ